MALTQISTNGIKNSTITGTDLATNITLSGNLNFADDKFIKLGAGEDLKLTHTGSRSEIHNITGDLLIRADSLKINNAGNTEELARFTANGAVELYYDNEKRLETVGYGTHTIGQTTAVIHNLYTGGTKRAGLRADNSNTFTITDEQGHNFFLGQKDAQVELYYDNSKKLETRSWGVQIYGDLENNSDSSKIKLGASDDLQIYHDGSKSVIADTGTGGFFIAGSSISLTNAGITETMLYAVPDGGVALYYDNSQKLVTTSYGALLTGNFKLGDNRILSFGDDDDLQIYHNGSASYISDQGTGELILKSNSISFTNAAENEYLARFFQDSAVELYFNGSKKFHTKNSGVYITGDIETSGDFYMLDNEKIRIGNSQDLELYHDSSSSVIKNLTNDLYVQSIADIKIRTNDSELAVDCTVNGSVALYYDASKKFETNANGVSVVGTNGSNPTIGINHSNADVTGEVVRLKRTDLPTIRYHSIMAQHGGAAGSNFIDFKLHDGSTTTSQSSVLKLFGSKIVHVDDNVKLDIGTGSDLQIYHNGSHSIAKNGTGDFYLAGDSVKLVNAAINEDMLVAEANGAVKLYFNNGQKFETRSDGVKLSQGHFYADDHSRIKLGDGQDLQIYHDGTHSRYVNSTGLLLLQGSDIRLANAAGTETLIKAVQNGSVELYYDDSIRIRTQSYGIEYHNQQHKFIHSNSGGVGAYLSLFNTGTAAGGKTGIVFGIGNSNAILDGTDYGEGQIKCFTDSGYYGNLEFNLHVGANRSWMKIVGNGAAYNGAGAGSEGMRGGVAFGCAGIAIDRSWTGQPGIHVFNANSEGDTDQGTFRFHGWNRSYASYPNNSGSDFSVNLVADGTGLSSDERRKTGIATITNALDTITKMRGVSFQFVNRELDPQTHMSMDNGKKLGFIAQEVIPLLPQLILDSGEKNVPLENGWCDRYSMDYSGVTAVLVEAIKELAAKVASLESKITE